jgi:hypothetical protein
LLVGIREWDLTFKAYPKCFSNRVPPERFVQDRASEEMKHLIEPAVSLFPAEIVFAVKKAMLSLRGSANAFPD